MIGNFLVFGKLLCWLDSSSNRIWLCSCCHHHNPPLWIIMAEKQGSLWLSTAFCRPFLSVFILALIWWHSRSQNAEPECCDDLHWDLWGIGGHGNGLLCLLVSCERGGLLRLGWTLPDLFELLKERDVSISLQGITQSFTLVSKVQTFANQIEFLEL